MTRAVQVVLAAHLRALARTPGELRVTVEGGLTQRSVLDAREAAHSMLVATIRHRATGHRRALVRCYACAADLSRDDADVPLGPGRSRRGAVPGGRRDGGG